MDYTLNRKRQLGTDELNSTDNLHQPKHIAYHNHTSNGPVHQTNTSPQQSNNHGHNATSFVQLGANPNPASFIPSASFLNPAHLTTLPQMASFGTQQLLSKIQHEPNNTNNQIDYQPRQQQHGQFGQNNHPNPHTPNQTNPYNVKTSMLTSPSFVLPNTQQQQQQQQTLPQHQLLQQQQQTRPGLQQVTTLQSSLSNHLPSHQHQQHQQQLQLNSNPLLHINPNHFSLPQQSQPLSQTIATSQQGSNNNIPNQSPQSLELVLSTPNSTQHTPTITSRTNTSTPAQYPVQTTPNKLHDDDDEDEQNCGLIRSDGTMYLATVPTHEENSSPNSNLKTTPTPSSRLRLTPQPQYAPPQPNSRPQPHSSLSNKSFGSGGLLSTNANMFNNFSQSPDPIPPSSNNIFNLGL